MRACKGLPGRHIAVSAIIRAEPRPGVDGEETVTIPAMFDLTGRVALVAGGTKGIGEAFARQYVEHGGRVTIAARTVEDCDVIAAQLNDRAGREVAWGHPFDLGDTDSIETLLEAAVAHWGQLDTLFCCSYYAKPTAIGDRDTESFLKTLRYNVVNYTFMSECALEPLKRSDLARIIFVGSASGVRPSPFSYTYGVAKLALMRMAQNLAIEWGHHGIRVNTLTPGMTRTPSVTGWSTEEQLVQRSAEWPVQRVGEPDEIAAGGIYLASPGSGFTTGHELVCDGGRTLLSGNTGSAFKNVDIPED